MTSRLLGFLDRFNSAHPWSHNDAYTGFILREARKVLREGGTSALDVGCGSGNLLLHLSAVFSCVVGVEADSSTASRASQKTSDHPSVTVVTAAFPADVGRFDFVSLVAVLHHLPLEDGVRAARDAVKPGGRLVIVGMHREGRRDLALSLVSLLLNPVIGFVLHHRRRKISAVADGAMTTRRVTESYNDIRSTLRAAMPGIRMRRGLFWRYTAVWQHPDDERGDHHGGNRRPRGAR